MDASGCCCGASEPRAESVVVSCVEYEHYDDEIAKEYCAKFSDVDECLALRCYTSNLIGKYSTLVLHGGGNTSVKMVARNAFGDEIEVLCVKGSGYNLDSIIPKGFPQVDLKHLRRMLELETLSDPQMVNELRSHMLDASSPTPSVETLLHALIPQKYVDHSHADAIVAMADHDINSATRIFSAAFGDEIRFAVVPYHMPGFGLARAVSEVFKKTGDKIDCLILLKHGIFTWGDSAKESYEKHIKAVSLAEKYASLQVETKKSLLTMRKYVRPSEAFFDKVTNVIRGVFHELSGGNTHWVLQFRRSPQVAAFAQSEECERLLVGPITPDHVIRTKAVPCLIRGLEEACFYSDGISCTAEMSDQDASLKAYIKSAIDNYVSKYHSYFEANNSRVGGVKIELDPLPRVLLLEHFGLFTIDKNAKACAISADIYEHTVPTIVASVASGGSFEPISTEELFDVEYWDLEQAKLKLGGKPTGRLQGRVALVTGGGSGIGLSTALKLAIEGACVCIADLHKERVDSAVIEVSKRSQNKHGVIGVTVDVSDRSAVERAFHKVCLSFGGIDILVSNAGIVIQAFPGIASVEPAQLEKSMNVNFFAHQWVSSAAVRRMITQNTGGCLLYNISKAPISPGPALGPYCVAKAGALALMRQYCVEYGSRGIRSNAVNADRVRTNLFDMELVEKRANARGLSADQYFTSNLLKQEVLAEDVAEAFLALAVAEKTTGCVTTVDGGNIAAALR